MGSGHLAGSCGPGPGERKRETCIRNMSRKLLAVLVGTSTTSLKTGRCWRRALPKRGGERGLKFIVQGGEKHAVTGHSFVAEASYAGALDRDSTRVVSCNTTSIVRTLTALKRAGLLRRARGTLLRRATDLWESHQGGHHEYAGARARDPQSSEGQMPRASTRGWPWSRWRSRSPRRWPTCTTGRCN
jgi:hypothetical protein